MKLTEEEKAKMYFDSKKIMEKYPGYYPIYCYSDDFQLGKNKYLVHGSMSFGQFMYVVKKKIKLRPEEAVFFLIKNGNNKGEILPKNSDLITSIYTNHYCPEIGCIYTQIVKENTFG